MRSDRSPNGPLVLAFVASLGLCACATQAKPPSLTSASAEPKSIGAAVTQPIRDLGLQREKTPEILLKAAAAPYAPPPAECEALKAEIAALDEVLGHDVDAGAKPKSSNLVGDLATDAVQSATKLPFRGVIRRLTGAEKRAAELRQATLAGAARRAFLKGSMNGQGCNNPAPLIAQATPAADAAAIVSAPPAQIPPSVQQIPLVETPAAQP